MESHLTFFLLLSSTTLCLFLLLSHMAAGTFRNAYLFRQYSQCSSNDGSCFAIFFFYGSGDLSHQVVLFECRIYSGMYVPIFLYIGDQGPYFMHGPLLSPPLLRGAASIHSLPSSACWPGSIFWSHPPITLSHPHTVSYLLHPPCS